MLCGVYQRNGIVFEVIVEPNRRAILSLLVSSQQSVGEIERQLGMPQPTVSKHLRVLREAGFVESTVDAQRPSVPAETRTGSGVGYLAGSVPPVLSAHMDALERHLDRIHQSTPTTGRPRRRRRGQTANVKKEKRNENQSDQRVRGRPR